MDEELRLLAAGYTDATEVVLLWWPANALDGARLAAQGIAVLYLVAADADPPTTQNFLTDWARLRAEPRDLRVRVSSLDARRASLEAPPRVDRGDHLRYRGRFLSLPADEAGLAALLVDHFGCVVSDRTIEAAGLDDGEVSVRARIARLRARFRSIGLDLRRVRGRGYELKQP